MPVSVRQARAQTWRGTGSKKNGLQSFDGRSGDAPHIHRVGRTPPGAAALPFRALIFRRIFVVGPIAFSDRP
jgi:hypothetical protein